MKKFLFHFGIFLVPFILIASAADTFLSKELKKSNTYAMGEYPTWNDLFEGKINSEIVIYGGSKAWVQIDPAMIGDSLNTTAYNLGIDGHNFWLQYLRHKILLANNIKPKLIIYSLDEFTLKKVPDLYNEDQFLPYMRFNDEIKSATISYKGYNSWDYDLPLMRYFGKEDAINNALRMFLNPSSNPVTRVKGYKAQDIEWTNDFENVKKEMQSYYVKIDQPSVILFEKFLNECKKEGIKVVFVYSPEYIEGQNFIKNRSEIMELYSKFEKKYDVTFYDYAKDSMSYQKKYFYNALHLNKTGAELFTRKLIDTLRNSPALTGIGKHE